MCVCEKKSFTSLFFFYYNKNKQYEMEDYRPLVHIELPSDEELFKNINGR
jgi:hypothetical protein